MTTILLDDTKSFQRAERSLRSAENIDELEDFWGLYCDQWADESPERTYLLAIYQDRAAQFAVELTKYLSI